jgi:hypothetical protein
MNHLASLPLQSEEGLQNRCDNDQKNTAPKPGGCDLSRILVARIPFLDRVGKGSHTLSLSQNRA